VSKRRRRGSRRGSDTSAPSAASATSAVEGVSESTTSGGESAGSGGAATSAGEAAVARRGPIGRVWNAWVELWDRREAPTALALTRILIATVMLADLLQAYSYGLVDVVWAPPPDGLGWGMTGQKAAALARWFGASADTGWMVWSAAATAAVLVIAGVATRLSLLVLALCWAQLGHFASDGDRGIDFMMRAVVLVLIFSQCHACWSVDAWLRRRIGKPFPKLVPSWPRYLIFAQLLWIYFSAGHNKTDKAWGPIENFEALGNILTDPHFGRFDPSWVETLFPLLQLATFATMVFELTSPVMILLTWWHSTRDRPGLLRRLSNLLRLRWVWMVTGMSFHVGIAVTMRLGIFPWGLLAMYPVLFHPDELARAAAWVQARVPRWGGLRSPSG
jgi:Vitamin K-dependent gamma-carboxylase